MAAESDTPLAEPYSKKEITERLEFFLDRLHTTEDGATFTTAETRAQLDRWLEEMVDLCELRCMCGKECKEMIHE